MAPNTRFKIFSRQAQLYCYSKTCGLRHLYKGATCLFETLHLGPDVCYIIKALHKRDTCINTPCDTLSQSQIENDSVYPRHPLPTCITKCILSFFDLVLICADHRVNTQSVSSRRHVNCLCRDQRSIVAIWM